MIQQCCNFPAPILRYTILYAQECYIIYSGAQPCNYCWQTTNYIPPSNLTIFPIKKNKQQETSTFVRHKANTRAHTRVYFNMCATAHWSSTPVPFTCTTRSGSGTGCEGLSCALAVSWSSSLHWAGTPLTWLFPGSSHDSGSLERPIALQSVHASIWDRPRSVSHVPCPTLGQGGHCS